MVPEASNIKQTGSASKPSRRKEIVMHGASMRLTQLAVARALTVQTQARSISTRISSRSGLARKRAVCAKRHKCVIGSELLSHERRERDRVTTAHAISGECDADFSTALEKHDPRLPTCSVRLTRRSCRRY
eukprot:2264386-Pleurochrysis_carterae.AAC.4